MTWWTAWRVARLSATLAKLRRKAARHERELLLAQKGITAAVTALGIQLGQVKEMASIVAKVREIL